MSSAHEPFGPAAADIPELVDCPCRLCEYCDRGSASELEACDYCWNGHVQVLVDELAPQWRSRIDRGLAPIQAHADDY